MAIDGSGYTILHNFADSDSRPQALVGQTQALRVTLASGLNTTKPE
jgi:hypothetical protein